MILLTGEQELVKSNGGTITLTNARVFMKAAQGSGSNTISIFLEKISSVESRYKSNPMLGLIGLVLVILGIAIGMNSPGNSSSLGLVVFGAVLIIGYYLTRKHVVSIMSDGGRALEFETESVGAAEVDKFLADVQDAKMRRMKDLKAVSN